jgi:hypothetical protein
MDTDGHGFSAGDEVMRLKLQIPSSKLQRIAGPNIQAPTSNIQRRTKHQTSKTVRVENWSLVPGVSLDVGCWVLEFFIPRLLASAPANSENHGPDCQENSAGETPALPGDAGRND